jgi:adenosylhomocysteinase
MSCSFANQTLAQIALWTNNAAYPVGVQYVKGFYPRCWVNQTNSLCLACTLAFSPRLWMRKLPGPTWEPSVRNLAERSRNRNISNDLILSTDIKLTELSTVQADYLGLPSAGPYKPDHYVRNSLALLTIRPVLTLLCSATLTSAAILIGLTTWPLTILCGRA